MTDAPGVRYQGEGVSEKLDLTNNWFDSTGRAIWDELLPRISPVKALEIGSFEGASACYLIERCGRNAPFELHCIDTWEGGAEHKLRGVDMLAVEERFIRNTAAARAKAPNRVELVVHKGHSAPCLIKLLGLGAAASFDFIYIDGSHMAPDVLADAVLSFMLLKVGGVMAFDDHLWRGMDGRRPVLETPKPAIDAFLHIYYHQMQLFRSSNAQVFARKTSA